MKQACKNGDFPAMQILRLTHSHRINLKRVLFVLAIFLSCFSYRSTAQVFIEARPERPHYERIAPPGPRHVWIDEDWEPRNGAYVFIGGRWVEPPQPGGTWMPGHWRHRRHGWVWIPGHWR
jgi:hypothetical protein